MMEENVAAIATPAGKGGVAIIRISGKNPLEIAEKMFKPVGKTPVAEFASTTRDFLSSAEATFSILKEFLGTINNEQ